MKMLEEAVKDGLKVLLGKKLTEKEMQRIRDNDGYIDRSELFATTVRARRRPDNYIEKETQIHSTSLNEHDEIWRKVFTPDGYLERKMNDSKGVVIEYKPPGSFRGERVR